MASRIVLCDHDAAFRGRLVAALEDEGEGDIELVGDVTRVAELQPLLATCPADVVVLDIDGDDGRLGVLVDVAAETNVVVVSGCDRRHRRARLAGGRVAPPPARRRLT